MKAKRTEHKVVSKIYPDMAGRTKIVTAYDMTEAFSMASRVGSTVNTVCHTSRQNNVDNYAYEEFPWP